MFITQVAPAYKCIDFKQQYGTCYSLALERHECVILDGPTLMLEKWERIVSVLSCALTWMASQHSCVNKAKSISLTPVILPPGLVMLSRSNFDECDTLSNLDIILLLSTSLCYLTKM